MAFARPTARAWSAFSYLPRGSTRPLIRLEHSTEQHSGISSTTCLLPLLAILLFPTDRLQPRRGQQEQPTAPPLWPHLEPATKTKVGCLAASVYPRHPPPLPPPRTFVLSLSLSLSLARALALAISLSAACSLVTSSAVALRRRKWIEQRVRRTGCSKRILEYMCGCGAARAQRAQGLAVDYWSRCCTPYYVLERLVGVSAFLRCATLGSMVLTWRERVARLGRVWVMPTEDHTLVA